MQPCVAGTVQSGTGAKHFGHARYVEAVFKAQFAFKIPAHFLIMRLRPENDFLELDFVREVVPFHFLAQQQGHGSGAAQAGGAYINQELEMHFNIARPNRDGHAAKLFTAKLKTYSGGPEPVANGYLHPVFGGKPCKLKAAGHLQRKSFRVLLGVGHYLAFSRCAGRGVQAHNLVKRHRQQRIGVAVAQIGGGGQREFADVVQSPDVPAAGDPAGGQAFPVKIAAFHHMVHSPAQTGKLIC